MIKYEEAPDIKKKIDSLVLASEMKHLNAERIFCIRSYGSKSRGVVARCHALPKIMQKALNTGARYVIEVISEKFDRLSEEQQMKTLIHELMHIPKSFGGGFIHHNIVNSQTVNKIWKEIQ